MITTKVILDVGLDPWQNLAIEEYLLQNLQPNECILYLWQNQNTVVIGRNQNAWRECQTKLLEEENGKLARRLSGGGAVFHDIGNLNFTFLVDRKLYDLEKQLKVILEAVQTLGIKAKFSGRNDLVVDDQKFSGNAFYLRSDKAFHHGTILVNANFSKLARYLQVSKEKMESKGIKSVQSRVTNLINYVPDLTIEKMKEVVSTSFLNIYGGQGTKLNSQDFDQETLRDLHEKYASWEWRYGGSPSFDIVLRTRFNWGDIEIGLSLKQGKIMKADIFSDAMDEDYIANLPSLIEGIQFHSSEMANKIRTQYNDDTLRNTMAEDIANWLSEKGF